MVGSSRGAANRLPLRSAIGAKKRVVLSDLFDSNLYRQLFAVTDRDFLRER